MQLSVEFAKAVAAGAMVKSVKDESGLEKFPYRKLFRTVNDKILERTIRPENDIPMVIETPEGHDAPLSKIYEPYGGTVTVKDFKVRVEVGKKAARGDLSGQIDKLAGKLKEIEGRAYNKYCAQIFNRAFSVSYTGGDSKPLCSTTHPLKGGGTDSNTFSDSQALTPDNVASAIASLNTTLDNHGEVKPKRGKYLVASPYLHEEAHSICYSMNKAGTADNDANFVKSQAIVPVIWPEITSQTAWFLVAPPEENGLIIYENQKIEVDSDVDIVKGCYVYVVSMAFDIIWIDWRGVFGDEGA
jgi:hypothetical protein